MSTKHYAVIGHPIGHTMSPFIHKRLFELAGADADYTYLDIAPETLAEEYQNRLRHLDGFNITIPHKEAIIPLLDALDDKAKMYGSVNTVALRDGKATGYTTDPDGFIKALEAAGIADDTVIVLGTDHYPYGLEKSSAWGTDKDYLQELSAARAWAEQGFCVWM